MPEITPERLIKLMTMEYHYNPEEAARLVKKHAQVVMNGILNNASLDAVIMSIQIVEDWESRGTSTKG